MPMFGKRLECPSGTLVEDQLEGLCLSASHVRLLDGFPQIKVAFNEHHDRSRVALVSGGGSGHEPAFGGFVGDGLLSAAACGDIYAAPPADAVFAAIRAVTGDAGCLLLPLNYTGDLINFGQAAERAKGEGLRVKMVLIDDDCAIRESSSIGRRGLAGAVLTLKAVGACAQHGMELDELAAFAQQFVRNLGTIGVGLDTCAPPGRPPLPSRLAPDEIEIGLGIHGEPGVRRLQQLTASTVVDLMLTSILTYDPTLFRKGDKLGIMVNCLGGMSVMDLNIMTNIACTILQENHGFEISFIFTGKFLTSVTVSGFSLTLLKMEQRYLELLRRASNAPAWSPTRFDLFERRPKIQLPPETEEVVSTEELTEKGETLRRCILSATTCLMEKQHELDAWDAVVGDGDCGSTLAKAASTILTDMENYSFNSPSAVLKSLARSVSRSAGGTSGALYSIFFAAGFQKLPDESPGLSDWVKALESGIKAVETYGRAKVGDRTMLDSLYPAWVALKQSIDDSFDLTAALNAMSQAAQTGAEETIGKIAKAGRSSYIPKENLMTVPDPGAKAVAYWLSAVADTILDLR